MEDKEEKVLPSEARIRVMLASTTKNTCTQARTAVVAVLTVGDAVEV